MKTHPSLAYLFALASSLSLALSSRAATFSVSNLNDAGPGSLRQAIEDANIDPGSDTITFAVTGTITPGGGGILRITNDVSIVGPGPAYLAVSGKNSTRVLSIGIGSAVNISGLTIRDGLFFSGGGVFNFGTLVMSNCVVTDNAAFDGSVSGTGGDGGYGGGIYNSGALTLIACTVSNNRAGNGDNGFNGANGVPLNPHGGPGSGGGPGGDGGGIYNLGALTLIGCTVNNNAAGDGGTGGNGGNGVFGTAFPPFGDGGGGGPGGNGGSGGGLYNVGGSAALTLSNCTLYGNSAGRGGRGGGGGLPASNFLGTGIGGGGGSGGQPGEGGGVYNFSFAGLALTACTVSSNSAGAGGSGGGSGPGVLFSGQGRRGGNGGGIYTLSVTSTFLRSSLAAANRPGVPGSGGAITVWDGLGADLRGTNFVSQGHNFVGKNDGAFVLVDQKPTDIVPTPGFSTNAMLGVLGDNGGPTLTAALLTGSPAIDAGDDTLPATLATDQRGAARLSGAHADIGAFELQLPVVRNTNDSGPASLRDTLTYSSPLETVTFDPSLAGQTIQLTSGQLTISKSLTINAAALASGIAIDAGGNSRVIEIAAGANVTLDSLTLMNGRAVSGGGILVNRGGTLTLNQTTISSNSAAFGGGIASHGTLTVSGSTVLGNFATNNSGGIENDGGVLIIGDSIISSNSAAFGGGIANFLSGTITVTDSTFSGNTATNNGGAMVNNSSTLSLSNSTVSGNSAGFGGGLINVNSGAAIINDSAIFGNRSANNGGGIENVQASLGINNSTLSSNSASFGGGIRNANTGTVALNNCSLFNNFATNNGGGIVNNSGTLTLNNSTLAGNSGGFGGGIYIVSSGATALNNSTIFGNSSRSSLGGGIRNASGTCLLTNTIVAGNTAVNDLPDNISGSFSGPNNLTSGDPLLAPLGNYGGPTPTMPPLPDSPAIDAGSDAVTAFLAADQRGYPRQYGAHVDIGAVELRLAVVNNLNDSGDSSLRAAVASGPELIAFASSLSGETITLTSGQIVITSDITIDGSTLAGGISFSGNHNSRIFQVNGGANVILDSLTLMDGTAVSGGGIVSGGTLTLIRTTLSDNSADNGGAIVNYGTLTIRGSWITGNFATNNSGGIENNGGTVVVENSAISGNSAKYGGGIANYHSGRVAAIDSEVSGNSAGFGGGIFVYDGTATVDNTTLARNTANDGAGIANLLAVLTIRNSTLSANFATNGGGGILNYSTLALTELTNTIVAANAPNNISGSFSGANNLTNGNPLLAPLGNYGGPTRTMPPLHGSLAIDAGSDSVTNFLATDQRDFPRRSGTQVDIGAVEAQVAPANNPPLLANPAKQVNGTLTFSFTNIPNADFTVLASTNVALPSSQWSILGAPAQYVPGQYLFTDSNATNYPRRFYQVVSP